MINKQLIIVLKNVDNATQHFDLNVKIHATREALLFENAGNRFAVTLDDIKEVLHEVENFMKTTTLTAPLVFPAPPVKVLDEESVLDIDGVDRPIVYKDTPL